jgi:hypothetical protein
VWSRWQQEVRSREVAGYRWLAKGRIPESYVRRPHLPRGPGPRNKKRPRGLLAFCPTITAHSSRHHDSRLVRLLRKRLTGSTKVHQRRARLAPYPALAHGGVDVGTPPSCRSAWAKTSPMHLHATAHWHFIAEFSSLTLFPSTPCY